MAQTSATARPGPAGQAGSTWPIINHLLLRRACFNPRSDARLTTLPWHAPPLLDTIEYDHLVKLNPHEFQINYIVPILLAAFFVPDPRRSPRSDREYKDDGKRG